LKGIRLQISDWKRPSPETEPVFAKAAGLYMICTLSKHTAERAGYEDSLLLDWRGLVAEATGANVFFVMNGEIHTPLPDCFLNGITRQSVIALAKKRGYKVIERHIKPEEMAKATECFLTGTAAEVTPVREIGPYKFTPGDICRNLVMDFDALVGRAPEAASSAA
jgi:branched-chain amino acid aminotransferase